MLEAQKGPATLGAAQRRTRPALCLTRACWRVDCGHGEIGDNAGAHGLRDAARRAGHRGHDRGQLDRPEPPPAFAARLLRLGRPAFATSPLRRDGRGREHDRRAEAQRRAGRVCWSRRWRPAHATGQSRCAPKGGAHPTPTPGCATWRPHRAWASPFAPAAGQARRQKSSLSPVVPPLFPLFRAAIMTSAA